MTVAPHPFGSRQVPVRLSSYDDTSESKASVNIEASSTILAIEIFETLDLLDYWPVDHVSHLTSKGARDDESVPQSQDEASWPLMSAWRKNRADLAWGGMSFIVAELLSENQTVVSRTSGTSARASARNLVVSRSGWIAPCVASGPGSLQEGSPSERASAVYSGALNHACHDLAKCGWLHNVCRL